MTVTFSAVIIHIRNFCFCLEVKPNVRQNLTGEELAQKAGVGRSAVVKMRKGQPVWRTTAGHVAAALGVDVTEIIEEED